MKELPREKTENGIHYTLHGDYYLPDISIPDSDKPIGKWGRMRLKFLMENKPSLYNQMILTGHSKATWWTRMKLQTGDGKR